MIDIVNLIAEHGYNSISGSVNLYLYTNVDQVVDNDAQIVLSLLGYGTDDYPFSVYIYMLDPENKRYYYTDKIIPIDFGLEKHVSFLIENRVINVVNIANNDASRLITTTVTLKNCVIKANVGHHQLIDCEISI